MKVMRKKYKYRKIFKMLVPLMTWCEKYKYRKTFKMGRLQANAVQWLVAAHTHTLEELRVRRLCPPTRPIRPRL